MVTDLEASTTCCYAVQDKVWVHGPDGTAWEVYTVLADADPAGDLVGDGACCASEPAGIAAPVSTVASSGATGPRCC